MTHKALMRLAAGTLGTVLIVADANAQQTGTTQTGSAQTGSTQTGGFSSSGGGSSGSTPLGGSSSPLGMNLQSMNFNTSTSPGATQATGATGRRTTGRNTGRTGTSSLGRGSLGGSNLGGSLGRSGSTGSRNASQNERRAQYVTRLDFEPTTLQPGSTVEMRANIEQSLASVIPPGVKATFDGSTMVLSGSVPSDHDRKLAEQMLLLEPGVRSVRNELVVQGELSSKP